MKKITLPILFLMFIVSLLGMTAITLADVGDAEVQNALIEVRAQRQEFKDAKTEVANATSQAAKEKSAAKKQEAELKRSAAEKKVEEKRKAVLLKLIDLEIKHFNKTNDRVQKMPNITDELKAQLKTEIEAAVSALNEKKTEVQSATGKDNIKKLAKDIKGLFKTRRDILKSIVDAIHTSQVDKAVSTAEERVQAMKLKLNDLKNEGQTTSDLSTELSSAEEDVAAAKENASAKGLSSAVQALKNAYEKLENIAQKAKGLK